MESSRLQATLSGSAYSVFDSAKKELEKVTMTKISETIVINKIILEWKEFKDNTEKRKTA